VYLTWYLSSQHWYLTWYLTMSHMVPQTLYSGEKTQPETCEGPSRRARGACAMAGWLGEDGGQEMKAGDIALVGPHTCYWVGS
jgi:hypothetical protein